MRLPPLLAAAVISIPLGCGDPAPPPVPHRATQGIAARPTSQAAQPGGTPLPVTDTIPQRRFGPFTIEGGRYTAIATRFAVTSTGEPDTGTTSVEIRGARQRVVYAERVMRDSDIAQGSWNDFGVSPLEDGSGRARALILWNATYPSAPNTGEGFSVLVARGDTLRRLFTLGYFGTAYSMATNSTPGSERLLAGDRLVSSRWMYFYEAKVTLHVAFDCAPGSGRCLNIVLPESIAGLARFPVVAKLHGVDTTGTIKMFDAPLAQHGTTITVGKESVIDVLGGAGKVSFEWMGEMQQVNITDDWLLVRVDGHTGWITGDKAYQAIGLHLVG